MYEFGIPPLQDSSLKTDVEIVYKIKPWKHQLDAVEKSLPFSNFAFLMEPGCGKSGTMITRLRHHKVNKVIIFAPPIVVPNWLDEWQKHSFLDKNRVVALLGPGGKRLKTFEERKGAAQVFVTNYESLSMAPLFAAFKSWDPEVLVWDESHKLKSTKAKRSKLADQLANPQLYKERRAKPHGFILTGTAILNSPMDIFQQFKIMDGGETFGTNEWMFRARYFINRNAGNPRVKFPDWQPKTLAKDGIDSIGEINRLILAKAFKATKEECLDLPAEHNIPVKVPLGKEQARVYQEMKKDLVAYYRSKACVASLAITKLGRLMEICSGFVTVEGLPGEPRKRLRLDDVPKLEALEELLETITEDPKAKVIVWAVYRGNYPMIREVFDRLKLKYVEVHGDVKDKDAAVKAFNQDPSVVGFIGHPGSGGIGINLTCAGFDITYSRSHGLADYLQAKARNHRGGSKEAGHDKIVHYELICENTVDSICLQKLQNKEDMSDRVLQSIVEELENV